MPEDEPSLIESLRREILFARERVYHVGRPTPIERLALAGDGPEIWVKREDLGPIKAYKWRGAYNRMALLTPAEAAAGVVTASAGNHAQGVALAARVLGIAARIHMPRTTPGVKVNAVRAHGDERTEIILRGDSYDEAVKSALAEAAATGSTYIHAYDDLHVIAGQGTLADEVVLSGHGPFDAAFLQIGGGGMAAGVACWLKTYWPGIRLIGVEGEGQACMKAAFEAGCPVRLDSLDIFSDGTAVRQAGDLPFRLCRSTLDEIITVSNSELGKAMRILWEGLRCVSEPAGAMGLAGALQRLQEWAGKKVLVVQCGANIDFLQLGLIAQSEGAAGREKRTLRIRITEEPGTMLRLLDNCFQGFDVADFLYGKQDTLDAWPVLGVAAPEAAAFTELARRLDQHGYQWEDVTGALDVRFRAIPLRGDLLAFPLFLNLEFFERAGALHDFLDKTVRGKANFCYFNYRLSGERVGRALIGLDFDNAAHRAAFLADLAPRGDGYRSCHPVPEAVHARLVGGC